MLAALRGLGFYGIKFGDEQGLSGADTILLDGKPVNGGSMLAAQAEGHDIVTIEALGEHPEQGWRKTEGLHPLQRAFVESGAIQCGYCTPAQILAAKALLDRSPNPSEEQVREAIAGVLCRCTGYLKPVQAILKAAAQMRGPGPILSIELATEAQARALPRHLALFRDATSLGGVESLVEWRRKQDPEAPPTLLRLSVGLEDPEDLVRDLERGLARLG